MTPSDRYANMDELPYDYPSADDHQILEELRDHFDGRDINEETFRRTRRAYYALCTRLDDEISRVLDALDRLGLAEDTLVVCTSDHGEPLGDHETWWKCKMYEQSAEIPMIVAGPSIETQTVGTPVLLLDLVPTMADAVGVETDDAWQGYS